MHKYVGTVYEQPLDVNWARMASDLELPLNAVVFRLRRHMASGKFRWTDEEGDSIFRYIMNHLHFSQYQDISNALT